MINSLSHRSVKFSDSHSSTVVCFPLCQYLWYIQHQFFLRYPHLFTQYTGVENSILFIIKRGAILEIFRIKITRKREELERSFQLHFIVFSMPFHMLLINLIISDHVTNITIPISTLYISKTVYTF